MAMERIRIPITLYTPVFRELRTASGRRYIEL